MRIDFSWGSDRARIEHPVAQAAEVVLGRGIAARTFGPGLPWMDVLFVVPPKSGKRKLKTQWRWRNTFAGHLIVELPAPAIDHLAPLDAVYTLIEAASGAVDDAVPHLDKSLPFDAKGLKAAIAACVRAKVTDKALAAIRGDLLAQHEQRHADLQRGEEAMRQSWKRPLTTRLRWVRMHAIKGGGLKPGRALEAECRMVGALLGSALYDGVSTPGYVEIYVNVGSDEDIVRFERTAVEDWHENAYVILPPDVLGGSDPRRLRRTLFDASRKALAELARIDHLDAQEIERRLCDVDAEGLATEFVYKQIESGTCVAQIVYSLADRSDLGAILRPRFYMVLRDAASGRSERWLLGPVDLWESARVLTKFELRNGVARVTVRQGSKSEARRFELKR